MNLLAETNKLLIHHVYEDTFLQNKVTGEILFEAFFYGDPTCAVISDNNDWAAVAGERLILWKSDTDVITEVTEVTSIFAMRIKNNSTLEVLVDPWSPQAAVWEIRIENLQASKIRDFFNYQNKEYTEDVHW